jgi:multisubunit Na+/H+ antiporter MnhB subunit
MPISALGALRPTWAGRYGRSQTPTTSRNQVAPADSGKDDAGEIIPYSTFDFGAPTVNHPSEFHQAVVHFIMQPKVPLRWKLYYLTMSCATIALQGLALLGLMSDIEAKTTPDILSLYQDMNTLDWWMSILVGFLTAFSVQSELSQSRLAEVMIKQAMHSEDEEESRMAIKWSFPLMLIMRVRNQVLAPLVVVTAPILAIENGLNALNVALNVMAILFIFDFDDGVFLGLLTQQQREYLENVDIVCSPSENRDLFWMVTLVILGTPLATVLPLLLYDPRWQPIFATDPGSVMAAKGEGVFSWTFCSGDGCYARVDPTQTCVWIVCVLVFGTMGILHTLVSGVNEKVWQSRKKLLFWALSLITTILLILLGAFLGWYSPYTKTFPPPSPPPLAAAPSAMPSV